MVNIDSINWIESQNAFSISSRRIFGRNISYNYYKDHQKRVIGWDVIAIA